MFFFEGHKINIPTGFDKVKWVEILQETWKERYSFGLENDGRFEFNPNSKQKILKISDNDITPGIYVGTISCGGERINIYPKVFYSKKNELLAKTESEKFSNYVFSHLLWWIGYKSDHIRLLKTWTDSSESEGDLLEIYIYFFSYYTEKLLKEFAFSDYTLVEDNIEVVRGRIKFSEYARNYGKGKWQTLPSEFSEFQHDNLLNRIIKYVAGLLREITLNDRSKSLLDDILFHLDGVTDIIVVSQDCDRVKLNPMYQEYIVVLDYCRMFLDNLVVDATDDSRTVFSFLIDMHWMYESFLMEFMKKNSNQIGISHVSGKKDNIGVKLGTDKKYFNISLDYFITMNSGKVIIGDAKYKKIYEKESSETKTKNFGVDSGDLYQMIAYSFRKGVNEITLLYPKFEDIHRECFTHQFHLLNSDDRPEVKLTAQTLPITLNNYNNFENSKSKMLFSKLESELIKKLSVLFNT